MNRRARGLRTTYLWKRQSVETVENVDETAKEVEIQEAVDEEPGPEESSLEEFVAPVLAAEEHCAKEPAAKVSTPPRKT